MPFSKSVLFSRLIGSLTCNVPARWIRLVFLVLFFTVVLFSLPVHLKHDSANAQSSGRRRTQGAPSPNLPNLDETRGIEPGTPKIMPPVPATKCRGRDEKCKKAKGMISDNLLDNQDRPPAYAGHRLGRDHANWLNTGIPALSMLAYLVYWPASIISNFPDMPYRDGGDVSAESAVKGANPRNEIYGKVVSRGPRKGYGYRSRPSLAAAQSSIVSVSPGAHQTPALPIESAVTDASNTGHGSTTSIISGATSQTKSCLWSAFQNVPGIKSRVTLKFDWSLDASVSAEIVGETGFGSAEASLNIDYSTDGGSNWTSAIIPQSVIVSVTGQGSDSDDSSADGSASINLLKAGRMMLVTACY